MNKGRMITDQTPQGTFYRFPDLKFTPRSSEAAKPGQSCAAPKVSPAHTALHFVASLLRRALILLTIVCIGSAVYSAEPFIGNRVPAPVGGPAQAVLRVDRMPAPFAVPPRPAIPLTFLLADSLPDLSSATLGPWFTDMLKVLAVIFFLLSGVEKVKGIFGRTPPIHVELETMRSQIIPKKKIEEDFKNVNDTLERIEDKQQESAEMLAANTAIRDGNGKLLAELTKSHTKLNDDFRTLCGTITQFMKDHGGRGK